MGLGRTRMLTILSITVGLGIAAFVVSTLVSRHRRKGLFNLGMMSEHWVAEHRAGQPGDGPR